MKIILFVSILMSFSFSVLSAEEELVCVKRSWGICKKEVPKSYTAGAGCAFGTDFACLTYNEIQMCLVYKHGEDGQSECRKSVPYSEYMELPPAKRAMDFGRSESEVDKKVEIVEQAQVEVKVAKEKAIAENTDYKPCDAGDISRMSDSVNSCNFLEESMLSGDKKKQTGMYEIFEVGSLMLFKEHYNNQDYKLASQSKCEECHRKAFDAFFEGESYGDVKERLEDRIKKEDIANAFDKLLDESIKMRQFFNHHKGIFEQELAKKPLKYKNFSEMPQSMDLLNKSNQRDQYALHSEVGQNPLERFEMSLSCFKLKEIRKMAEKSTVGANGKRKCLDKVNSFVDNYFNNSNKVKDLLSEVGQFNENDTKVQQDKLLETAIDLQGFEVSDETKAYMGENGINDFLDSVTGVLYNDFDKINNICKEAEFIEDTPITKVKRSRRIAEQILLGKMDDPDSEVNKEKVKRMLPELININPSFYYFLNDSTELCETMKHFEDNREMIKGLKLLDLIERNIAGINQAPLSPQDKIAQLESDAANLYKLTCNASEQALVNMICNEELEDRPNLEGDFALLESDGNFEISAAEQVVMNAEICKRHAPKPPEDTAKNETDTTTSVPIALTPVIDVSADLNEKRMKSAVVPNTYSIDDVRRDMIENANEGLTQTIREIRENNSGSGVGTIDAERPRNALPADIIQPNENPARVQEVRDIFNGSENNTVASNATLSPVENEFTRTVEKVEEPNEFSRMLNQMQSNAQNLNTQANNFVSGKSYNDMINSGEIPEPTKSEIQDVLATDSSLGESIGDVATKYLKGENSEQLLSDAISGDEKAEDELLEQVKNKEEIDELKAEIEKLKKGAYVSAAEKKAIERAQAAEEKVKKLEERLAKFEKVQAAKTNNQTQAGNSSGSFNNSLGVSAGGASGSIGRQRLTGGLDANSNTSSNFRSVSAQQGNSSEKNVIKQIPTQVKINPEQWIKNSDFVVQSDDSGFFLQIVDQGLTHKDRVPLTPRDVKFDNVSNPQYVMIKDIVVPIKFSTLDNKTKTELRALVGQNPEPEFTAVDAAVKEVQAAEVELEIANQEVNHYKNFRSCLLNPNQGICK